jgi:hypothetical protein
MTRRNGRPVTRPGRRGAAGIAAVALLSSAGLAGCGLGKAANAVRQVSHDVAANKATIDDFTAAMKSGAATRFEATYVTTGTSPATIIYAVRPPNGLAVRETPAAGSNADDTSALDFIVTASGEYSCSAPTASGSGSGWACQRLGKAAAASQKALFGFYTPAHWVTFLRDFSFAAGFAGDEVGSSHLTVNGFTMRCVDFRVAGVTGTSKICTTAQGLLGYVKIADDSANFELESYSTSPSDSLFRLPPGATVATPDRGPA